MTGTDGGREQLVQQLIEIQKLVHQGVLAVRQQVDTDAVASSEEAQATVRELGQRLEQQSLGLEQHLAMLGRPPSEVAPEAGGGPPVSTRRASQALEGDNALLQRLSLAYLGLHSASQALGDLETARLADYHYQDTQSLIRERISRTRPRVAAVDQAAPGSHQPGTID